MQDKLDVSVNRASMLQENVRLMQACEEARSDGDIYSHIAYALARDYTDLFYVNVHTGEFVEYRSDNERGALTQSRCGDDFYKSCVRDAAQYVHPDDRDVFVRAMSKDPLLGALNRSKEFQMSYRRVQDNRSFYVQLKASLIKDDDRFAVIAVSDINELVLKRKAEEQMQEERIAYARLNAITGNFIVVYVVEPKTDCYRELSSTDGYAQNFSLETEGKDFFEHSREVTRRYIHPADLGRFLAAFTKKNVMAAIERSGIFSLSYRLAVGDKPTHVQLRAAMVEESGGSRLIVGLNNIDEQVRQELETEKRLAQARAQANVDALTGVKNRHAYLQVEEQLNSKIKARQAPPFAIAVLDINDLKIVNDTGGHHAGDQCLRDACRIICDAFKHSPVFRVGGDEFAVIAQGKDYVHIQERVGVVRDHNRKAQKSGVVVIACGMATFEDDPNVAAVFDRADRQMYADKGVLKRAVRGGSEA